MICPQAKAAAVIILLRQHGNSLVGRCRAWHQHGRADQQTVRRPCASICGFKPIANAAHQRMATAAWPRRLRAEIATCSCRSCVELGYFQDDFVRHFVRRPQRRPPLINRGVSTPLPEVVCHHCEDKGLCIVEAWEVHGDNQAAG
jgi:hypothetical protein